MGMGGGTCRLWGGGGMLMARLMGGGRRVLMLGSRLRWFGLSWILSLERRLRRSFALMKMWSIVRLFWRWEFRLRGHILEIATAGSVAFGSFIQIKFLILTQFIHSYLV